MNRSLLWKEWREQRPLVLTGLLVTALMPLFLIAGLSVASNRPVHLRDLGEAIAGFYVLLLWPLFAAAAGAGTVATEIGDGTLGFLLSRPVSRLRVWLVKVGLAAAAFVLVVLSSVLVSWILQVVGGGGGGWRPKMLEVAQVSLLGLPLAAAVLVMFSTAVFFSTVLSRAMNAAAAGLVTALTLLSGIYLVWSKIDLVPLLEPQWMALEMVLVALLILLASLYLFSRGEMLRGKGARKTALVAAAVALLGAGVVSLPVMFASTQVSAEDAWFEAAFLSPSGNAVVASVARARAGGASPQVWLVPTDGSRFHRLTGRLTMAPSVSPDGEWLAYVSVRGALGMRSNAAPQIRVMRLDGSDDRAIGSWQVGQISLRFDPPTLVFSPDGSQVLGSRWSDTVRVYSVQGHPQVEIALKGTVLENGVPFDWSPDGSEVLVFRHPSEKRSGSMLGAMNLETGQGRVIFETAERAFFPRWIGRWVRETPLLGSSLAVIVRTETPQENYEYRLSLIDLKDGTRRPITRSFCLPSFDLHRDSESIVYVTCPEEGGGNEAAAELHRWGSDGSDEVLRTALDLPLWSVFLSPAGDRVLFSSPAGIRMLGAEGIVDDLGAEYSRLLGWAGKDRVVIHEGGEADPHVQVVNVTDGSRREIFPRDF